MKNILGILTIITISFLTTGCADADADVGLVIEPPADVTCQYVWYPVTQSYVWTCPEYPALGVPYFAYDRRIPPEYGFRFRYDVPRREVHRDREMNRNNDRRGDKR